MPRVIDRATSENPAQYAEGMVYVLVNGVPVVRDGSLVEGVASGRGLRQELCQRLQHLQVASRPPPGSGPRLPSRLTLPEIYYLIVKIKPGEHPPC